MNPDFAPFLQKIKDTKPDAVFIFLPPGAETIAFMKGFTERGLAQAGIKLISTGDLPDEDILEAIGDASLGLVTVVPLLRGAQLAREQGLHRGLLQGLSEGPAELHVGGRL